MVERDQTFAQPLSFVLKVIQRNVTPDITVKIDQHGIWREQLHQTTLQYSHVARLSGCTGFHCKPSEVTKRL